MSAQALSPLDGADIAATARAVRQTFAEASTLEELKSTQLAHLDDAAPVTQANALIRGLDKADKPVAGKLMGAARKQVRAASAEATTRLEAKEAAAALKGEKVDVIVPTRRNLRGARHPFTVLAEDVADFLIGMGWETAESPEVEHEWLNFDTLNFGPNHPARQMQGTFYVSGVQTIEGAAADVTGVPDASATDGTDDVEAQPGLVLHTHTSPMQGRKILERGASLYIAYPGKAFRVDALDATHTPVFHQVEDLTMGRGLTMAHLRGTFNRSARAMFGPEAKTRLRPSFFPFTEPSAEMDLWFPRKKGDTGWVGWGGYGMVNPEALRNAGIDPDEYTGPAFGMGSERTLMFRHGIADMRDMVEGNVRFFLQFRTTGGDS